MNENIYEFILFLTIFLTIRYDHSAFSFISTFYPIRKTNFRLFESNRLDFYNLFGPNNEDYVWNTIRRDANTEATSEVIINHNLPFKWRFISLIIKNYFSLS